MTHRLRGRILRIVDRLGYQMESLAQSDEEAEAARVELEADMAKAEAAATRLTQLVRDGVAFRSYYAVVQCIKHSDGSLEYISPAAQRAHGAD